MKKSMLLKVLTCVGSWVLLAVAYKQADKAAKLAADITIDLITEYKQNKK